MFYNNGCVITLNIKKNDDSVHIKDIFIYGTDINSDNPFIKELLQTITKYDDNHIYNTVLDCYEKQLSEEVKNG